MSDPADAAVVRPGAGANSSKLSQAANPGQAPGAALRSTARELIVALDVPSAVQANALVAAIGDAAGFYKVGKQLFTAEGPPIVRDLTGAGKKVFLDLKFHDIPNTVAGAVKEAAKLGVDMLTVHASGGGQMLRSAVEAAKQRPGMAVLAVTVLTSLSDEDLDKIGVHGRVLDQVMRLAAIALADGCHGLVASAQEAKTLRDEFGPDFLLVTPGVRLPGGVAGDQARVVTPAEAFAAGASHIVVGRPVTESADPAGAVRAMMA
jgi:orotidine-5'-phosphate decarboxylase